MKKKIFSLGIILMLGVMVFILTGCGEQKVESELETGEKIYRESQDVLDSTQSQMSQAEISSFNAKFETYEGDKVSAANVKALINLVTQSNMANEDRQVELTGDTTKSTAVNSARTYKVELDYDSKGFICEIIITKN